MFGLLPREFLLLLPDKDKDGSLSADEFAHVQEQEDAAAAIADEVSDPKLERDFVEARRREFTAAIDRDADERATLEELLAYVDPRNERHADTEVAELFELADTDGDKRLTLEELLARVELLATSGFVHPRARLHDDL